MIPESWYCIHLFKQLKNHLLICLLQFQFLAKKSCMFLLMLHASRVWLEAAVHVEIMDASLFLSPLLEHFNHGERVIQRWLELSEHFNEEMSSLFLSHCFCQASWLLHWQSQKTKRFQKCHCFFNLTQSCTWKSHIRILFDTNLSHQNFWHKNLSVLFQFIWHFQQAIGTSHLHSSFDVNFLHHYKLGPPPVWIPCDGKGCLPDRPLDI